MELSPAHPGGSRQQAALDRQFANWARRDPQLAEWLYQAAANHPPGPTLRRGVTLWTRLHGVISLEIEGHFAPMDFDPSLLYDAEVAGLVNDPNWPASRRSAQSHRNSKTPVYPGRMWNVWRSRGESRGTVGPRGAKIVERGRAGRTGWDGLVVGGWPGQNDRRGTASPAGDGGQEPGRAMCGALPTGLGGGPGQRITPGLVVQFGEPGLTQGLDCAVWHHRGLLSAPQTHAAAGGR